ncbi:MAG: hypothetical protein EOO04_20900 [Chitinophagaceae bacterium]|nr:MAG: hypothetical protein EOO04_20900 [Chitinophagaceae bacterium]
MKRFKPVYSTLIVFFLVVSLQAQCISGDCENGTGSAYFEKGVYSGSFSNALPHGKGTFTGVLEDISQLDSVVDKGTFHHGFFLSGSRQITVSYSKQYQDQFSAVQKQNMKKRGSAWLVPGRPGKTYDYPEKRVPDKRKSGNKETETYYIYQAFDRQYLYWTGNTKRGVPDGTGVFENRKRSIQLILKFEKGLLQGSAKILRWTYPDSLTSLVFANGMITELTTVDSLQKKLELKAPTTFHSLITNPTLTGDFLVKYPNGERYLGDLQNGARHGYGILKGTNGESTKGYWYQNMVHGEAIYSRANGDYVDSGLYLFGRFTKGIAFRAGQQPVNIPVCLSGDCENGTGKARFQPEENSDFTETYSGNFVNGIPNGYGTRTMQKGKLYHRYRGTFSNGLLKGYGEILANYTVIQKLNGIFHNDTLVNGRIYFDDGSSFEYDTADNQVAMYARMIPIVFGAMQTKTVRGTGTYHLKSGSIIKGRFNAANGVATGVYTNAKGISFDVGHAMDPTYSKYGIPNSYQADDMDDVVKVIAQKITQHDDQQRKAAIYHAQLRKREDARQATYDNPAYWRKKTETVTCSACDGEGKITYSNTYGGDIETQYVDSQGRWRTGTIKRTGRTYTTRTTCSACRGKGSMQVHSETYVGP